MTRLVVKWQQQQLEVQIDLNSTVQDLKQSLQALTHVLPEKQKLMGKGKVLQNSSLLSSLGLKDGSILMMMGTPEQFHSEPVEEVKFVEDLTPEQKARAIMEKSGMPVPAGLVNLGNTCYMNSTVQVLRRVPELRSALQNYRLQNPNDMADKFTFEFGDLMKQVELRGESFTPFKFVACLRSTFPRFNETGGRGVYKQQDAEECFSTMLDTLSQKLFVQDEHGNSVNLVNSLFNIEYRTEMKCAECDEAPEYSYETGKKLMCIIDNQSKPIDHLADGIRVSLMGELTKYSPTLGRDALYTKVQQITHLPGYIAVHFVRFIWKQASSSAGTEATKCKILRAVNFPKVIDLYEFCSDDLRNQLNVGREMEEDIRRRELEESKDKPKDYKSVDAELGTGLDTGSYQLVGVVTHKGRSAESGHYVGWTHSKDDDWVRYDDDVVTWVGLDEIMQLKGGGDWHMAYILLYRKLQLIPQE